MWETLTEKYKTISSILNFTRRNNEENLYSWKLSPAHHLTCVTCDFWSKNTLNIFLSHRPTESCKILQPQQRQGTDMSILGHFFHGDSSVFDTCIEMIFRCKMIYLHVDAVALKLTLVYRLQLHQLQGL